MGEIPTLRQLAKLGVNLLPAIEPQLASSITPDEQRLA